MVTGGRVAAVVPQRSAIATSSFPVTAGKSGEAAASDETLESGWVLVLEAVWVWASTAARGTT